MSYKVKKIEAVTFTGLCPYCDSEVDFERDSLNLNEITNPPSDLVICDHCQKGVLVELPEKYI